jgi:hypothetical protein
MDTRSRSSLRSARGVGTLVVSLLAIALLSTSCSSGSSSSPSVVEINGSTQPAVFHDGQSVTVSMGPNKILKPYFRVVIIECADPGGKASNLPTSAAEKCDVDTVAGTPTIPAPNGSFSTPGYLMYQLPAKRLDEGPTWLPVCNKSNPCVLYVGENYNDFTMPKVFSAPFTVTPSPSGSGSGS